MSNVLFNRQRGGLNYDVAAHCPVSPSAVLPSPTWIDRWKKKNELDIYPAILTVWSMAIPIGTRP